MRGQNEEGEVNVPPGLQPVVVVIDRVWVDLHVETRVLEFLDVMHGLHRHHHINRQSPHNTHPCYFYGLVNLGVNNEVKLLQHHVALHSEVGELGVDLELLSGDWRLRLIVYVKLNVLRWR